MSAWVWAVYAFALVAALAPVLYLVASKQLTSHHYVAALVSVGASVSCTVLYLAKGNDRIWFLLAMFFVALALYFSRLTQQEWRRSGGKTHLERKTSEMRDEIEAQRRSEQ